MRYRWSRGECFAFRETLLILRQRQWTWQDDSMHLTKQRSLFVDLSRTHRLHRLQIHARNNVTTVIENMHVPWRVIADPPDKDVPTTTDSSIRSSLCECATFRRTPSQLKRESLR
jgi:hypothetical protein